MIVHSALYNCAVYAAAVASFAAVAVIFAASTKGGRAGLRALLGTIKNHKVETILLAPFIFYSILWGGTKPEPPPVITEEGIELTRVLQDSKKVGFQWEVKDDRIKPGALFVIQNDTGDGWRKIGETTEHEIVIEGFSIDKTNRYRIMTDITEEESAPNE